MASPDFSSPEFQQAIESAKTGQATTEAVDDTTSTVVDDTATVADTTITATTTTTDTTVVPTNYADYLKTASEGFFDSEDKFKEFIPKIKNYDSLETKVKELEQSVPKFKNDESKAWFDLLSDGNETALRDYLSEKNKDYKTMSDIDVRREALAKANPEWSKNDVELEIRVTYGENLEKIDLEGIEKEDVDGRLTEEYKDAVAHNKDVDRNLLLLSRDARDDRHKLIDSQSKIELPKIQKEAPVEQPAQPTAEEIQQAVDRWKARVKEELPNLPNIKLTIDNKEVEYVQSDEDKQSWAGKMESFNIFNYARERGWVDANGVSNPLKIAEDRQKIEDFDKMVSSFATQVKTTTTKKVIGEIKNIDNTNRGTQDQAFESLADAAHAAKEEKGWK